MTDFPDLLGSLDDQEKQKQADQAKAEQLDVVNSSTDKVVKAVDKTTEGLNSVKGEVKVTNPDLAKSQDVNQAVEAINKLNLTTFMQNEGLPQLADNISQLSAKTQDLQDKLENEGLKKMGDQLSAVVAKLDEVAKVISKTEVSVDSKLQKTIDNLSKSIDSIDFNPSVNVAAPDTKVVTTPIDLSSVIKALGRVEQAVNDSEIPETKLDLSPVISGLSSVQNAIQALRFPVPNYVLPFQTQTGKDVQVKLNDDGSLPITASISTGALATSANQTNGAQLTQIVDAGGEAATVTGGKLDVNATASLAGTNLPISGAATAVGVAIVDSSGNQISSFGGGTQYTDAGTPPAHPIGGTLEWNNAGTWATVGSASPLPVSLASVPSHAVTNAGTFAVQASQSGTWNIGTVTALTGITNALPAGSNVIGHVITDTGSTTAVTGTVTISGAVTEATLDAAIISQEATTSGVKGLTAFGAVTTNAPTYTTLKSDALSLDTSGLLRVSLKDTPANTNKLLVTADAITFASPQHIIADSGTISTITNVVHVDDNSGSLTVDNGGTFAVQATLSAETTKVIGVTRTADGAGNLLTSTGNALDMNIKSGSIANTSFAATQATAANLNMTEASAAGIKSDLDEITLDTDNLVTIAAPVRAEDSASADADKGIGALAIRKATPANTSGTDGDYEFLQLNGGRLWVSATVDTALPAGTNVIGHVITDTGSTTAVTGTVTVSGTVTTSPPSNASTNIAQINGVTPLMGNGLTGTGSQRVTIASDNTAFAVNSTLSAETTKVIGTVNVAASQTIAVTNTGTFATQATLAAETTKVIGVTRTSDGAGNLLTSNSSTFTAKFGLDTNLLGTLGTAFSTAGKVDVKGADGDVFVRQTTAANLNMTASQGGTWTVQPGNTANTTAWKVDGSAVTQPVSLASTTITGTVVVDDLAAAPTGSAVPANAQYQGNLAKTSLPSAASDGNLTGNMSDKYGRSVVLNNAMRDIMGTQTATITASTSETTIITAAASIFNDLVSVFISNTSATAARVDIRDTTAGSVIFQLYIPAGDMRGLSLTTPWPQTSVNTNWTATSSTSVTDLRISSLYIKNK